MSRLLSILMLFIVMACASQKSAVKSSTGQGDTRTKEVEFINDNTYLLTELTDDSSYGFNKSNPVKVGGSSESSGPKNERRFLNGLLGPNGEAVSYYRAGSCCHFKTPNGLMDNTGLLDHYRVTWEGSKDTLSLYINMYDKGDLKIPVGFTAKRK